MFIAFNYIPKFFVLTIAMVIAVQPSTIFPPKDLKKHARLKYACAVFFKFISISSS